MSVNSARAVLSNISKSMGVDSRNLLDPPRLSSPPPARFRSGSYEPVFRAWGVFTIDMDVTFKAVQATERNRACGD